MSMLDLGLDRKKGKVTGGQHETPLMTPDALPAVRWASSQKSIEGVRRRSPIMGGKRQTDSPPPNSNNSRPPSGGSGRHTPVDGATKLTSSHGAGSSSVLHVTESSYDSDDGPTDLSYAALQPPASSIQQQQQQQQQQLQSPSSKVGVVGNQHVEEYERGERSTEHPKERPAESFDFLSPSPVHGMNTSSGSISSEFLGGEAPTTTATTGAVVVGAEDDISGIGSSSGLFKKKKRRKSASANSPYFFRQGSASHKSNNSATGSSVTPSPHQSTRLRSLISGSPAGGGNTTTMRKSDALLVSPVRFFHSRVDKDVDFVFVPKPVDPIKEQFRRAESIIAAIPSSAAAPLPAVVDNGRPASSAAVLDGLMKRTALLQHDKTNTDRTASAMMGCHIAALLDLSRSLAMTDPNGAEVTRRVHDVLTSHVAKSVEQPLERVSALYESAKAEAGEAREHCVDLRSQLLDAQAEVQNLRRQLRRRDDLISYLTSAYNLPTIFKNSISENKEFIAQTLSEEASPSALVNQRKALERQRAANEKEKSSSPHASDFVEGFPGGIPEPDPSKTPQELFQVIIPKKK